MRLINKIILGFSCFVFSGLAAAKSVTPVALFKDRAMISVDGAKAKIIRAGSTYKGVKLVSSSTSEAVIEIDGQRETLTLEGGTVLSTSLAAKPADSYSSSVTLYENEQGFFESNGEINGRGLRFLVDTGANLVVLSSQQADRVGLEYRSGARTYASTASGNAPMYAITVKQISLGGIKLNNIQAGVIEGSFPQKPLLGMTFLSKLDMNRSGKTMVLKRR